MNLRLNSLFTISKEMDPLDVLKTKYSQKKSEKIYDRLKKDAKKAEDYNIYIFEKIGQLMVAESATKVVKDKSIGFESEFYNETREEQKFKAIDDRYEITEGVYMCKRKGCGSKKHFVFQLQERSRDEPMTTYVVCAVCGNQFKFNM